MTKCILTVFSAFGRCKKLILSALVGIVSRLVGILSIKKSQCIYGYSHEPNEETLKAMKETDEGKGLTKFNSLDELFDECWK